MLTRFFDKVEFTATCWLWLADVNPDGYGRVKIAGRKELAHRVAYLLSRGEILLSLEIDHLCQIKHCVNPDHLEVVTHTENMRRSKPHNNGRASKTHCFYNHEYTTENTRMYKGRRICRT